MRDSPTTQLPAPQAAATDIVSVIVPCRNEAGHIEAFCDAVRQQQLPPSWTLEILIADGQSDDGTRERLQALVHQDPRFVLIDNPARIVSPGLNAAIAQARGRIVVRMDVHTRYAPDYIHRCIDTLAQTGADNVGGPWRAEAAEHPDHPAAAHMQQAIAVVFQSRWVAGGALSRQLDYNGWVDTVYLGAWPRASFERFGGFDETLVRNQDDEHNLRIHRGGGKIWQSAAIQSAYRPRASLTALFRQYLQYGYWKPFVMRKHGQAAALRHLIPGAFVLALGLTSLGALAGQSQALVALLGLYGSAVLVACALMVGSQTAPLPWPVVGRLPLVTAAYHLGYGIGSVWGWFDVLRGRRQGATRFARLTR